MLCYAYSEKDSKKIEFASQSTQWKHKLESKSGTNIFKWTFLNNTPDIVGQNIEKRLFNYALLGYIWRFDIEFEYTDIPSEADIVVQFKNGDSDDFLKNNVIAYAGYPKTTFQGLLVLNEDYLFSEFGEGINANIIDPINYPDPNTRVKFASTKLVQTFKHEIGHLLGRVHNESNKDSVMYPFYSKTRVMLQKEDIYDLNKKYNKNPDFEDRITRRKIEFLEKKLLKNKKLI